MPLTSGHEEQNLKHPTIMYGTIIYCCILLIGLSLNSFGQSISQKEKLTIPQGKVGLIGYGSLLSKKSMESTLGKEYNDTVRIVHINGYERIWNNGRPNDGIKRPLTYFLIESDTIYPNYIIALNIQPAKNKAINSCLFIIDNTDLAAFDKREYGYEKINVKDKIQELDVAQGDVYAYIALPDFTIKVEDDVRKNIIAEQYVKLVENSSIALGDKFEKEFHDSTVPYSTKIVKSAGRKLIK